MKAITKLDCHRRIKTALLRRSGPISADYKAGDMVCFQKDQGAGSSSAQSHWHGPARIIGFDGKAVWLQYETAPVLSSTDRLRPCTSRELLAFKLLDGESPILEAAPNPQEQRGFVDTRSQKPDSTDQEMAPAMIPVGDDEDILVTMPPTPRPQVKRRPPFPQLQLVGTPPEESPLLQAWRNSGTQGKGVSIVQAKTQTEDDAKRRKVEHPEDEDMLQPDEPIKPPPAPISDLLPEEPFVSFLAQNSKKATLAARGKVLIFDRCDPAKQAKLRTSRAAEWAKWKDFDATTPVSVEFAKQLMAEGHTVVHSHWVEVDKNEHLFGTPEYTERLKSRLVVRGD